MTKLGANYPVQKKNYCNDLYLQTMIGLVAKKTNPRGQRTTLRASVAKI